jgi:hypothetical protein
MMLIIHKLFVALKSIILIYKHIFCFKIISYENFLYQQDFNAWLFKPIYYGG